MSNIRKNLFYQSAYQILNIILPLVTAPYVSRVLGAENIGIYSYTYNIANYFVLFAMLGIANYGNREIAKVRDDQEKLNKTFSNITALHIVLSIIMLLLYTIYIILEKGNVYTIICSIYIIGALFDINWFFFGLEKFKITVTRNTIVRILTVICIFIFVRTREDLWIYITIMAVGNTLGQSMVWFIVRKYVQFIRPEWKEMKKHFKPMLILFVPVIAISLYKNMDKIMLGILSTKMQVGYYENAGKIINIPLGLITAVGTVMLPKMSNIIAHGQKDVAENYIRVSMKYVMIAAFAVGFGVAAISPVFTPIFFGDEFIQSDILIQGLSITIPFIAFANVLRTQFLIPNSYDKSYIISILIGAVLNIIANLLLIPKFAAKGAVIGTIIAEVSVCIFQTMAARKELPIKIYIKQSLFYLFLGLGMNFVVRYIGVLGNGSIYTLFIQVLSGIVIYLLGTVIELFISKDKIIMSIIHKKVRKNK